MKCEPTRVTEIEPGAFTKWHQLRCSVHGWIATYPGDLEELRPKMVKRFERHVREQDKNNHIAIHGH